MATLFYKCPFCGNVVVKIQDGGVTPFCCGFEMIELIPDSTDASEEKHVPVVEQIDDDCGIRVTIGSKPHPMTAEHHIGFIWIETAGGGQFRLLYPSGSALEYRQAIADFCTCKDPAVTAVYEYCNQHGLWKLEMSRM